MTHTRVARVVGALKKAYGAPERPPARSAFEYYLWDRVGYLFDDTKRRAAFERLRKEVGLTPAKILAAPKRTLASIASEGGIEGGKRAEHMRQAAEMVAYDFDGSLDRAARGDLTAARKTMNRLPMTADAGADRILMFAGVKGVLGLESNGLRVLQRIGYGEPSKNFAKAYRSVRDGIAEELTKDAEWAIEAHLLLRQHGREVCRATPLCEACVLRIDCQRRI